MINLPTVAILIADTRDHQLAVNTLAHCCKYFKFGQAIFLTDISKEQLNFDKLDQDVYVQKIDPINSTDDYSNLILYNLHNKFIYPIQHLMIVQTDGFITNPDAWNDKFLAYDYIGAPWRYHPNSYEPPHPECNSNNCVGNGGFSIRSIRLIEATYNLLQTNKYPKITPEDLFICRTLKPELDKLGIIFAPEWLATNFSCENRQYKGQFGFHGKLTYERNKALLPIL